MPKVTMDVPEGFEEVVEHLEKALQRAQKGVDGAQAGDMEAFDAAWQSVNVDVEEAEQQMKRRLLRAADLDTPQILIDSKPYARVGRYAATYKWERSMAASGAECAHLSGRASPRPTSSHLPRSRRARCGPPSAAQLAHQASATP